MNCVNKTSWASCTKGHGLVLKWWNYTATSKSYLKLLFLKERLC